MNIARRTHGRCAFAGLVALVFACHDATRPPEPGSIRITTVTTGFDADADGYVVTVDSGATHALEPNGSLTLDAVPVGTTDVRLDGLATNCSAANGATRRVTVTPGRLTTVDFAITCIVRAGTLTVSVTTSGIDLPPDGYAVEIDGFPQPVGVSGQVTFFGAHEGLHSVRLRAAANCTVDGLNPRTIAIAFGQTATTAFTVACVAARGTLRITTTTLGFDADPDGYTAIVYASLASTPVPASGQTSLDVAANLCHRAETSCGYRVALTGVAANCLIDEDGVNGTTRFVRVDAGATVDVPFAVTCDSIPTTYLPAGSQLAFVRDGKIHLVNSNGTGLVRLSDGPNDGEPAWSPDGRRIAFSSDGAAPGIYVMDADGANVVRLTTFGYTPTWSPDGTRVAFATGDIYVVSASDDGSGATVVVNRMSWDAQPAWSPDGLIAFASDWAYFDGSSDIFVTTPDGSRITQLTTGLASGLSPLYLVYYWPAWSPDGRKLAAIRCRYTYDLCVTSELSIMNADGAGLTILLTGQKVSTPTWSPDGQTIAFSSAGEIGWIRSDGSERGIIVSNGHSPAWRPATSLGAAWSTSAKRDRVADLFPFRVARAPAAPGISTPPRAETGDRPR